MEKKDGKHYAKTIQIHNYVKIEIDVRIEWYFICPAQTPRIITLKKTTMMKKLGAACEHGGERLFEPGSIPSRVAYRRLEGRGVRSQSSPHSQLRSSQKQCLINK